MSVQQRWEERYTQNELPWDTGCPDTYLVRTVSRWPVQVGLAFDVGCGTGTNSIWLAEQGFDVVGLDISQEAVKIAAQRAEQGGVSCSFICDDFLTSQLLPKDCLFVFDRGCFHAVSGEGARECFVDRVASCLCEKGLWLSLIGNADDSVRDSGPPRLSAREIVRVVEPRFELLDLASCLIESRRGVPPRFWQALLRKRCG